MKTTMEGPKARYLRCNDGDGHDGMVMVLGSWPPNGACNNGVG
jgi:hypothetical protein